MSEQLATEQSTTQQHSNESPAAKVYRTFDTQEIREIFSYHPPTEAQRQVYERINLAFIECAEKVAALTPDGPGKTVAIRKLADARMAANAAVALEGRF